MKWKTILVFLRDVAIAAGLIGVLLLALFLYTSNWPPMVVIESDSMQHGNDSELGIIDTGDLVLVKKVHGRGDVVTYVEGRARGYRTYGDYGDVIIYRKNGGDETPVIHRPVLFLVVNNSTNASFDIPGLGKLEYGKEWEVKPEPPGDEKWRNLGKGRTIYIKDYGYKKVELPIVMDNVMNSLKNGDIHDGFITVGDHNAARGPERSVDQGLLPSGNRSVEPVKTEWIVGKARGELPWFGLVKLKVSGNHNPFPTTSVYMIFVTLAVVIALPMALDFTYHVIKKRIKGDSCRENEKDIEGEDFDEEKKKESSDENDEIDGPALEEKEAKTEMNDQNK